MTGSNLSQRLRIVPKAFRMCAGLVDSTLTSCIRSVVNGLQEGTLMGRLLDLGQNVVGC